MIDWYTTVWGVICTSSQFLRFYRLLKVWVKPRARLWCTPLPPFVLIKWLSSFKKSRSVEPNHINRMFTSTVSGRTTFMRGSRVFSVNTASTSIVDPVHAAWYRSRRTWNPKGWHNRATRDWVGWKEVYVYGMEIVVVLYRDFSKQCSNFLNAYSVVTDLALQIQIGEVRGFYSER